MITDIVSTTGMLLAFVVILFWHGRQAGTWGRTPLMEIKGERCGYWNN